MKDITETTLLKIRQDLHQIPELALNEFQTIKYIRQFVAQLPQEYLITKDIPNLPTGWLVKVIGKNPTQTLGYRTDLDGLAVTEKTNLAFKSKNIGIMHACGHDMHMTVALGILDHFAKHQPNDNLIFIFQPAEENFAGGMQLYDSNVLVGDWKIDAIYGLHINPSLPAGTIGCRQGTLFAGTTEIHLKLVGKSGHAAFPQDANDMVVALSQWVNLLQTIVARNVDPIIGGVVTIGAIEAGSANNVIAGEASAHGTIRALKQSTILAIQDRVKTITDGIAQAFDCQAQLILQQDGYLPVENNDKLTTEFIKYMKGQAKIDFVETNPAMTGEDFGYLLSKIPGVMFWLGVDSPYSLHSEYLAPSSNALNTGVNAITKFLEYKMA